MIIQYVLADTESNDNSKIRSSSDVRRSPTCSYCRTAHPCYRSHLHTYDGSSKALPPVRDEPPVCHMDAAMLRSVCIVDPQ